MELYQVSFANKVKLFSKENDGLKSVCLFLGKEFIDSLKRSKKIEDQRLVKEFNCYLDAGNYSKCVSLWNDCNDLTVLVKKISLVENFENW